MACWRCFSRCSCQSHQAINHLKIHRPIQLPVCPDFAGGKGGCDVARRGDIAPGPRPLVNRGTPHQSIIPARVTVNCATDQKNIFGVWVCQLQTSKAALWSLPPCLAGPLADLHAPHVGRPHPLACAWESRPASGRREARCVSRNVASRALLGVWERADATGGKRVHATTNFEFSHQHGHSLVPQTFRVRRPAGEPFSLSVELWSCCPEP
jgi:hypothetical protein